MNNKIRTALLTIGAAAALQACQAAPNGDSAVHEQSPHKQHMTDKELKARSREMPRVAGHRDAAVIPGVDRVKTRTTNEYGSTVYGMGSSVYSVIGSSGLHSRGLSSHLESRLSGAGIANVKVFALDDMVILASADHGTTASQYDPLQQKLLSPTGGLSGKGPVNQSPSGSKAARAPDDDNMELAKRWIHDNMGATVTVHTLIGNNAVEAIDRIHALSSDSSASPVAMASEIRKLLELVRAAK